MISRNHRGLTSLLLFLLIRVLKASSVGHTNPVLDKEYLIGVYYYPWHNQNWGVESEEQQQLRENLTFHLYGGDYLRRQLEPPQYPSLGEYDDSKHTTIDQHVDWCVYAGIKLWVTSWFGPNKHHDRTIRNVILQNDNFVNNDMKLALHYETRNRIKEKKSDDGTYDLSNVYPDMRFMARKYFNNTKYLHIDNKPVVFIYVSRWLSAAKQSKILDDVIDIMRQAASDTGYPSIYVVGDQIWSEAPTDIDNYEPFHWADAVTNYDSRNQVPFSTPHASYNELDIYYNKQIDWHFAASNSTYDCHFIPSITPGYNKRGQGTLTKPAFSRKIASSTKPTGSLFEKMLLNALSITDSSTQNLLMINSWNEWHEESQIEPVGNFTYDTNSTNDNTEMACTTKPELLTEGVEYCEYDHLYLNILRENILMANESSCYGGGDKSLIVTNGDFESTGSTGPWLPYTTTTVTARPVDDLPTLTLITPGSNTLSSTAIMVSNRQNEQDGLYQIHHTNTTCMFSIGQQWNIEAHVKLVDPTTGDGVDCNPNLPYSCPMLRWIFINNEEEHTNDEDSNKKITEFRVFDSSTNIWNKDEWNIFSIDITITPDMVHEDTRIPNSHVIYKSIWIGDGDDSAMTTTFPDLIIDDISFTRIYPTAKLPSPHTRVPQPSMVPSSMPSTSDEPTTTTTPTGTNRPSAISNVPTSSPSQLNVSLNEDNSTLACDTDEDCGEYSYCHPRYCNSTTKTCVDGFPPCSSTQQCLEPECNPCSTCNNDQSKCLDTFSCSYDVITILFTGIDISDGLCVGGANLIGKCLDTTCGAALAECTIDADCCSNNCRSEGAWINSCV